MPPKGLFVNWKFDPCRFPQLHLARARLAQAAPEGLQRHDVGDWAGAEKMTWRRTLI